MDKYYILNLFYELIKVSIGSRSRLSIAPSEQQWYELFDLSCRHSLTGITFEGVKMLEKYNQSPPELLIMKWFGYSKIIRNTNISC
jgi:hypothetical protein